MVDREECRYEKISQKMLLHYWDIWSQLKYVNIKSFYIIKILDKLLTILFTEATS